VRTKEELAGVAGLIIPGRWGMLWLQLLVSCGMCVLGDSVV
jgi:hypothetical protein